MSNRFTEKAEKALNNAVKTAEEFGHTYIGSEHILLSLCRTQESVAAIILSKFSITKEKIFNAIKDYSGIGLKSSLTPKDMTPCSKKIVENAYRISVRYNCTKIGTEHILLSLLEERDSVGVKLLNFCGADVVGITDEVQTLLRTADKNQARQKDGKDGATSPLRQHGRNLTLMAKQGKLDPIIGRDRETDRLIRTLCRKNKNNPCLIGEAGVGKTAIVEGLAQRIIENNVPAALRGKEIICIDLTSMVSGTKYRGDFEERIKSVISEAANNKSIILFIDEIHTIVGAGAAEGAIDAANILKPQLSRGEIQLIGATTFSEYHKYIERDAALERRFQPITVNESTEEETRAIMLGLKEKYESHHGVKISDSAIDACIKFSVRYIQDRFLPDKALDILDESCAKASSACRKNDINDENMRQLIVEKENAIKSGDFILAKNLHELERAYQNDGSIEMITSAVENAIQVSEHDVKEIIGEMTGVPIVGIGEKISKEKIISTLSSRVIGQEAAVHTLADSIMRSESGITSPEKPKGIFLFVGSSGVGKTEMANAISDALFFDKRSFFKYDMSEFSESNSITKLIGSPPGYVGHDEGGALTEKVRRHPYSILLFDEIERAHHDVLDLFLQIADNGVLTDNSGRSVSFRNVYIILTSNIGSDAIRDTSTGFISSDRGHERNERVMDALSKRFKNDFLNRIDEIIFFPPIEKSSMIRIANSKLNELCKRLDGMGIHVEFADNVAELIVSEGNDSKFGVRKLLRRIANTVETPLSRFINENNEIDKPIRITVSDNNIKIEFKKEAVTET